MDLIDIYKIFYPKATKYTFFSSAQGTFSKKEHMLRHKLSLNKSKKTEIISSIFSGMKLSIEINYNKKNSKHSNTWRLNSMLINNEQVNDEMKGEIKSYLETTEHLLQPKIYGIH